MLVELEDIDIDAVSLSGTTPLMSCVDSGHMTLVAEGLNNNLNPFLQDALGRTAIDIAQQYSGEHGDDMRGLLSAAMEQWMSQTEEEDRTGAQAEYSQEYDEFKVENM